MPRRSYIGPRYIADALPWQVALVLDVLEPGRWAVVGSLDELPPASAVRPEWAKASTTWAPVGLSISPDMERPPSVNGGRSGEESPYRVASVGLVSHGSEPRD